MTANATNQGPERVRALRALLFAAVALGAGGAQAADEDGRFAIKGAGLQRCEGFIKAWDEQTSDVALYGGWVEGYLTGANQRMDDVYDAAPWQTTRVMLGFVRSVCEQAGPETQFMTAFDQVLRVMLPGRLSKASAVSTIRHEDRVFVIYDTVIAAVEERLAELGRLPRAPGDRFNADTAEALRGFQAEKGLEQTGIPDQRTLFDLLGTAPLKTPVDGG